MSQKNISVSELLTVLGVELEFYRKGILQVFAAGIISQVLVITGQKLIAVQPAIIGQFVTAVYFLAVPFIIFVFYQRYGSRIKFLRMARTELIASTGVVDPTDDPSVYKHSIYHVYLVLTSALSVVGLVLTLFGE